MRDATVTPMFFDVLQSLTITFSSCGSSPRRDSGFTLVQLLVVLPLVAAGVLIALNYSNDWFGREEVRSGVYTIQSYLHLAQMQAVSRGRACRFHIDIASRQLQVIDLNDPADLTDDLGVASATLPARIAFVNPSGGPASTLELESGSKYRTTFGADGAVSAGAGALFIRGGDRFDRITIFGAGGTRLERWNGSTWRLGS